MENPITGIGEEGKLKSSKSSKQSTEARKRQAGIIKIIKAVNQSKKKTS